MQTSKARRAEPLKSGETRFPTKLLEIKEQEFSHFIIFKEKSLQPLIENIFGSESLDSLLACSKQRAREQSLNEHGYHHAVITANHSLEILRILQDSGKLPKRFKNGNEVLERQDLEAGVVIAGLLHDVGNACHREMHARTSISLITPMLHSLLDGMYESIAKKTSLLVFIISSVISHDRDVDATHPFFGIVRVADGLDMEEGRARRAKTSDMHKISAKAITKVTVSQEKGKTPVLVEIEMDDTAGLFQIYEHLNQKIHGSQLERFIQVSAYCRGERIEPNGA